MTFPFLQLAPILALVPLSFSLTHSLIVQLHQWICFKGPQLLGTETEKATGEMTQIISPLTLTHTQPLSCFQHLLS